ncbi:MAG: (Fe-S)-binding protein [Thermoplasmata archaeon]|nr:MAG: (Fe-S)-binding protein [Thermoplasmata archaeon]
METKALDKYKKEMVTCTLCGFCKSVCPVFEHKGWDSSVARGRILLAYGLLTGEIEADDSVVDRIFHCPTCNDCYRRCPSKIKTVEIVEAARKDLRAAGLSLPKHETMIKNILEYGNPYGETENRLEKLDLKPHPAKLGYFIGCTSAYRVETNKAVISILEKLGEDFTILDEVCCGSPMKRVGGSDDEQLQVVNHNLDEIKKLGIENLIFTCAGCFKMFKLDYPELIGELGFKPMHFLEYLAEKDLKFKPYPHKVTYHDPCHLGRHAGVYDAPRKILEKIPEIEFQEMEKNREFATCCGGGGGLRIAFPETSGEIAGERIKNAEFAEVITTPCPFCVVNLNTGKELVGSKIEVKDMIELIDELLE